VGTVTDDVTRPFDARPGGPAPSNEPLTPRAGEDRPLGLRGGLHRLSTGLIAYGIIGLLVAGLGLGALAWVNSRVDTLSGRVETSVDTLATTMERTADAIRDAATTAETFTVTLERSAEAVSAAADTIRSVRTNLETLENVLRAVNILGVSPLGPAADAVGGIADSIEGLDTRLTGIADGLDANTDALAANAASLGRLADSTAAAAERLRSGVVEASLDDVHVVIVVMLLLFVVWSAVPAVGALVLGTWLRREVRRGEPVA